MFTKLPSNESKNHMQVNPYMQLDKQALVKYTVSKLPPFSALSDHQLPDSYRKGQIDVDQDIFLRTSLPASLKIVDVTRLLDTKQTLTTRQGLSSYKETTTYMRTAQYVK